jgi:hypothetical protein
MECTLRGLTLLHALTSLCSRGADERSAALKVLQPSMFKVIAPLIAASALSLGAIGCTTTSIAPSDPHLNGQWQLDKSASDDADAKIEAAVDQAESKLRKRLANAGFSQYDQPNGPHRGRGGAGDSGSAAGLNGEEFSQTGYIGPDFNALRRNLQRVLQAPTRLTIDVKPDDVRIAGDGNPSRDYPPDDDFTRIDEYGTAHIDTSWSQATFRLRARYASRAILVETYAADTRADTLVVMRHLSDPVAGKITVRALYRR